MLIVSVHLSTGLLRNSDVYEFQTLPDEGDKGGVRGDDESSAFPWWVIVVVVASAVLLLGLLALVVALRRRSRKKTYEIGRTPHQTNLNRLGGPSRDKLNYFQSQEELVVRT